jgi:hypothetical protein
MKFYPPHINGDMLLCVQIGNITQEFFISRCWRKLHNEEKCAFCTSLILLGCFTPEGNNGRGKWHAWEGREMTDTGFWWKNVKEENCLIDLRIDRIIMLKCTLKK